MLCACACPHKCARASLSRWYVCLCLCIELSYNSGRQCVSTIRFNCCSYILCVRASVSTLFLCDGIWGERAKVTAVMLLLLLILYDILRLPRENYSRAKHILQLHLSNALRCKSVKPLTLWVYAHFIVLCFAVLCCVLLFGALVNASDHRCSYSDREGKIGNG